MDQIRDSLGRLSELSDEELDQLTDGIVNEFESADAQDLSPEVVDSMTELAAALEAVKEEKSRREAEAAELSRRRDEAVARVKGDQEKDTSADDVEPDADHAAEAAASTPAETDTAEAAELSTTTDNAAELSQSSDADSEFGTAYEDEQEKRKEDGREVDADYKQEHAEVENGVNKDNDLKDEDQGAEDDGMKPSSARPENAGEGYSSDDADAKQAELNTNNEHDNDVPGVTSEDVAAEEDGDEESADDNGEEEEPVTASAGDGVQAPTSHRPKVTERATVAITAGADIPGVTAGSELPNMKAIAEAMTQRMHGMRRTSGGDGEQHTVATLVASYPEDRTLRNGEPEVNAEKIDKVTSPQAITAAGGFCAPVEVDYNVDSWGVTDRPVKDALASFNADRGGIRWTDQPVLGDLNSAVSTWTLQDDIDAATAGAPDPTKPCLRVVCGGENTAYIDAIPLCLTFGNLQTRAFPEQVAANNDLALVTFARYAEQRLLTRIGALSTQVTAGRFLGAARDYFNQVDRAAVAYRNRHRMRDAEPLRVIAPTWLKNLIRADLVNNMPGDGRDGNFELADAKINAWFRVRNINPSWTIDGETGQIFGAQGAGALLDYPSTVIWYLFAEGTFLFLDGGTLDLGLVRDSTLNATNDYKMFVETFEGVAMRGVESLRVTSTLKADGSVAGTVDTYTGADPGAA